MALPLEVSRERVRLRAALVDPYAGSREGLRVSLIVEGCEVVTAADVRQATALVRSGGFDLGVIDLDLTTAGGTMRNALELATRGAIVPCIVEATSARLSASAASSDRRV